MRSVIHITFCLLAVSSHLYGQCLINGQFAAACTDHQYSCPTWTDACGGGWIRSHGTPQIKETDVFPGGKRLTIRYAYMYSNSSGTQGEGMFTPYDFAYGETYNVKINFATTGQYNNTNAGGSAFLYAANGLIQHALDGCGDAAPTPTSSQLIGRYDGLSPVPNGGDQFSTSFSFTPNANYAQLWIYPSSTTAIQYELNIFRVQVCPSSCTGTAGYLTGSLPLSVFAENVYLGGGYPSLLSVVSASRTEVDASQAINISPGFTGILSGTGSFSANIIPCNSGTVAIQSTDTFDSLIFDIPVPIDPLDTMSATTSVLYGTGLALDNADLTKVTVYPSVSAGTFNITGSTADLANADILVSDESGRIVFESHNTTGGSMTLNLNNLNNGFYVLQIRSGKKVGIKKIIISR